MPALNLIFRPGRNRVFGRACSFFLAVAIAKGGGLSGQTSTNLPPSPPPATQSACATPAASNPVGGGGIYKQIAIDPGVYGKRETSGLTVFGFSQQDQNLPADPQVLAMSPNIVPRAWARWDRGGVQPSDYNFVYPKQAQAASIAFIAGTTATALFRDEFPAASTFNAVVSCDATGQPVFHSAMKFYRGSLASPAYRQYLIGIGEMQIDGGVDGLFFDEVDFSYQGATSGNEDNGDEGFDDANIADFGGFLCGKYPNYSPADWQSKYGITRPTISIVRSLPPRAAERSTIAATWRATDGRHRLSIDRIRWRQSGERSLEAIRSHRTGHSPEPTPAWSIGRILC
jgi:hypothetical protein